MLTIFGVNGLTAYFAMTEIGKSRQGETIFVSSAAGGVGSIAGQIARIHGGRVIGSPAANEHARGFVTSRSSMPASTIVRKT
jgi:NADPH-dependent curcumin reductase CurA